MCGIVGIRRFDGGEPDVRLLDTMVGVLGHRGPDDNGAWSAPGVAFGHARLSIIDVGGSRQPMASHDGRYHLVFNGEIFNYRDIRRDLRYPFVTGGDTETVLAAFATWGVDAVSRFRGQFAYAIHDALDGSIHIVRDRLGVLPLYCWTDGASFIFGSEIKALLPAIGKVSVDEASLEGYLAHRAVPAPRTLFAGVQKVPQGHWMRIDATGALTTHRYWAIGDDERRCSPSEAVELVDAACNEAVELALVADVPVGALLSGGVDSSLVTALVAAQRGGGAEVDTFSAGFDDARFDELPYARQVSAALGTRHHEVVVTPTDFTELWPKLTWHRDAPISEPADVAVFRLAELARSSVKVILSGEGSDELFAGYPKYRADRWLSAATAAPVPLRRGLASLAERVVPPASDRARIGLQAFAASTEAERMRSWFAPFDEAGRRALRNGHHVGLPAEASAVGGSRLRRMLAADTGVWLADNLLERGDRMSMAAGVELRPPFLDHRLAELAFSLPDNVKVRRGVGKWVVKEVARRYVPASIVDRPKVGFRVPLDAWFRDGLRDEARNRLLDPRSFATEVFSRTEVTRLLDDHDRGRRNEHMRIWTLLCLEVWHEVFFRAPFASGTAGATISR